ncbi:uncharacterized protein [Brachyistius frenatus]|uniref:uncharacterized protein isoform X1 n=2 Tax=Brachyistius frenatus TaxID=100188 RepID=UPI0037E9AC23
MASSKCIWIAFFLFAVTNDIGVFSRAVNTLGFWSRVPKTADEPTSRVNLSRRWRRAMAGTHRERCAQIAAPWLENTQAPGDNATLVKLCIQPFSSAPSQDLVFPGKYLCSFIRRAYRCCHEGAKCRNVRGIQGRLTENADVELVLTTEILSLIIVRADLHLQLSNPHHLDIRPVLPNMAKDNLPTRYSLGSLDDTVDLRVDLLFLLKRLQKMTDGARPSTSLVNIWRVAFLSNGGPPGEKPSLGALQDTNGDMWRDEVANMVPVLDLGLVLDCSKDGLEVSCGSGGVNLLHPPFMAVYYR